MEEVVEGCNEGLKWMQLQPMINRSLIVELVRRAEKCGFKAIVVTCDYPIHPVDNTKMTHSLSFQRGNFNDEINQRLAADYQKVLKEELLDSSATWEWVDWLRGITRLPIVLKGIQRADDAREAISHDIQAILVSNHGGRKLDCGAPTVNESILHNYACSSSCRLAFSLR